MTSIRRSEVEISYFVSRPLENLRVRPVCIGQAWPNVLLSAVLLRGVQLGMMKQIEVLAMVRRP